MLLQIHVISQPDILEKIFEQVMIILQEIKLSDTTFMQNFISNGIRLAKMSHDCRISANIFGSKSSL